MRLEGNLFFKEVLSNFMVALEPDVNPLGSCNNSSIPKVFGGTGVQWGENYLFQDTKTLQKASPHQNVKVLIKCNPFASWKNSLFLVKLRKEKFRVRQDQINR